MDLKQDIMKMERKKQKLNLKMAFKMGRELITIKMEINRLNFGWKTIRYMEFLPLTIKMAALKSTKLMKKAFSFKY